MPQLAVGKALKYLRQRRKLTLREVGDAVGMHYSSLYRKEQGEAAVNDPQLEDLLKFFGVERGEFDALVEQYAQTLATTGSGGNIPLIGVVPAGSLTLHWQLHDDIRAADEHLARGSLVNEQAVALRVQGRSMVPKIEPGSFVICEPVPIDGESTTVRHGDLVVVSMGDGADEPGTTIGYWHVNKDGSVAIRKENAAEFEPVPVDMEQVVNLLIVVEIRLPTRFAVYRD